MIFERTDDHPGARLLFIMACLVIVVYGLKFAAAILLPALSMAREQAIRATCGSNLHQWGIALNIHAQDDGRYPPGAPSGGALRPYNWQFSTEEEMKRFRFYEWFEKNSPFWMCPNMAFSELVGMCRPYFTSGMWNLKPGYEYGGDGADTGYNWPGWTQEPHAPKGPADPGGWNLMNDYNAFSNNEYFGSGEGWRTATVAHVEGGGSNVSWGGEGPFGWYDTTSDLPSLGGNQLFNNGSVRWADFSELDLVARLPGSGLPAWGYWWLYR